MANKPSKGDSPGPDAADPALLADRAPLIDLSQCEREPIHIPGAIQPHGALLAATLEGLRISHASENLAAILGRSPQAVLGQTLAEAVGESAARELAAAAQADAIGACTIEARGARLHLRAHRAGPRLCIDIEPIIPEASVPYTAMQLMLDQFKSARTPVELFDLAVRALRAVTRFDRVIAYRFHPDGHGDVIAEECSPKLKPYRGQRYPATDIPAQARRLYASQPVGAIADSMYEPAAVLADPVLDDGSPLDLTRSSLRSVSPVHRHYMQNMQTRASLTIALTHRDTLAGMLICHHATPRRVGPELRALVAIIGHAASLLLSTLHQSEVAEQVKGRENILRDVTDHLTGSRPLGEALAGTEADILNLVDARGAVIKLGGTLIWLGRTPQRSAAERVLATLHPGPGGATVAINDLSLRHPELADCTTDGSGVLLQSLDDHTDDAILWFRPEEARTVIWGGNPADHEIRAEDGRILPRKSFEAWTEITRGRAEPWSDADQFFARAFRQVILMEVARRSKTANDLFHAMFEAAPNALLLVAGGGTIRLVNKEAERLFGYERAELEEQPVDLLVPERLRAGHALHRKGFMASPGSRRMADNPAIVGLRKDGSEFPIEVALSSLSSYAFAKDPMVQVIVTDVTQQRQIEQDRAEKRRLLEKSNADLEEFSYAVSHDLKAPLRAIGHLAQWIGDEIQGIAKPETLDDLKLLQERVVRMQKLMDGLLEYSRVGHHMRPPEQVDLAALILDIVDLLSPPPGFSITHDFGGITLRTERIALQVVLENLISNCIKHHDRTDGCISVAARRRDGLVEFRVTDDGPGIEPQFHQRIFAIFQTLKSRDVLEASGIGLSIVKRKIEIHGGQIWVESAPPARGTAFVFTWKDSS
jgi:PAS domain S-box-containing protein